MGDVIGPVGEFMEVGIQSGAEILVDPSYLAVLGGVGGGLVHVDGIGDLFL